MQCEIPKALSLRFPGASRLGNSTPSFSPEAETLALPWWSRSQGTRSHVTPRRARCYPVSARYSRVAVLCLPMRVEAHTPW